MNHWMISSRWFDMKYILQWLTMSYFNSNESFSDKCLVFKTLFDYRRLNEIGTAQCHVKGSFFKEPWMCFSGMHIHLIGTQTSWIPSGNGWHSYWKWTYIVDFPIKNGGSFHSYVKLPEGIWIPIHEWMDDHPRDRQITSKLPKFWP